MYYCYYDSPVGQLLLFGRQRLEGINFPKKVSKKIPGDSWLYSEDKFREALLQLKAYFQGKLQEFDLELALNGTSFQKKVWQELSKVPYGRTISYGELAARCGNPKAARAVGMANKKNPIPIIIPCHRVIGKNGHLTGFGGGLKVKRYLLDLEQANVE